MFPVWVMFVRGVWMLAESCDYWLFTKWRTVVTVTASHSRLSRDCTCCQAVTGSRHGYHIRWSSHYYLVTPTAGMTEWRVISFWKYLNIFISSSGTRLLIPGLFRFRLNKWRYSIASEDSWKTFRSLESLTPWRELFKKTAPQVFCTKIFPRKEEDIFTIFTRPYWTPPGPIVSWCLQAVFTGLGWYLRSSTTASATSTVI